MHSEALLLMRKVLHGLERRRSSDLGTTGEANGYGGSGGVGGGVLGRRHPIRLVHRLTAGELSMLRRPPAEPRLGLVVATWEDRGWE